jgi:hypothetical protein
MKVRPKKQKPSKSLMKLPKLKSVLILPLEEKKKVLNCRTHKNSFVGSNLDSLPLTHIIRSPSVDSLHYSSFQEQQEKQTIRYMRYGEKLSVESILLQLNKKKLKPP